SYIYPLSLHDALPICLGVRQLETILVQLPRAVHIARSQSHVGTALQRDVDRPQVASLIQVRGAFEQERLRALVVPNSGRDVGERSEEHTSELQSLAYL